jgi:hypothetical protein
MSDLQLINDEVINDLNFSTQLVSDFPPFFYFRPAFMVNFKDQAIGFVYTFCSTGSRISGKDYSGEYNFDMVVNSNSPGFCYRKSLCLNNKINLSFNTIVGGTFSNLTIKEKVVLFDSTLANLNLKFRSASLFLEPGLVLSYSIKDFNIGLNIGYYIQFGAQGFYMGNVENKLYINSSNEPLKPNWNGYRIGVSLIYRIYSAEL